MCCQWENCLPGDLSVVSTKPLSALPPAAGAFSLTASLTDFLSVTGGASRQFIKSYIVLSSCTEFYFVCSLAFSLSHTGTKLSDVAAAAGPPSLLSSTAIAAAVGAAQHNGGRIAAAGRPISGRRAVKTDTTTATTVVPTAGAGASGGGGGADKMLSPTGPRVREPRRPARFNLEASIDSLALFEQTHQGRFQPQASPDGSSSGGASSSMLSPAPHPIPVLYSHSVTHLVFVLCLKKYI